MGAERRDRREGRKDNRDSRKHSSPEEFAGAWTRLWSDVRERTKRVSDSQIREEINRHRTGR